MTLVKICGITNLEDALEAVNAGADMLGFNFYPPSPRYISPEDARRIIDKLPGDLMTIGVFVNESTPERVEEVASKTGITGVQLHGDESPDYCSALNHRYVVKALAVGEDFAPSAVLAYDVNAILLDAKDGRLRGGTGRVVDWTIAREVRCLGPKIFLAGGLSPANVVEAIHFVDPYAVDACSALEYQPGRKDHARVRHFVKMVRDVKP